MIKVITTIKDGDCAPITTERECTREEFMEYTQPPESHQPNGRRRTQTRFWQITFIETEERDPVSHRRKKKVLRRQITASLDNHSDSRRETC